MLNFALKYLSQGFSVIPLEPKGKKPLISWTEFQSRHATEAEVKGWFQKWPTANIGILTGTLSGIAVIDLDGPEGLASAQKLGLKSSVVSLTGNGKHLWFRANDALIVQNAVRLLPGLDVRGEGGYVVAPPSLHESGRRYRFINALTSVANLPSFPLGIVQQNITVNGQPQTSDINYLKKSDNWIAKALQEMKNGNIDTTLFTICSRLRNDGYSADDCRTLLAPHAVKSGATPGHLDEKIDNVWNRYEPRTRSAPRSAGELSHVHSPAERSLEGLIIHSPTNPASLKQFEQQRLSMVTETIADKLCTGYPKLDQMLQGGLKSSRLLTVAARTGVGKTNWLLGVTKRLCTDGKRVLLFSTEMPYTQIWERYIASLETPETFTGHQFHVCDSFAPNLERVEEAINEIKPDVFMFDHLNHISEEQKEISSFMQGLNWLRRKYDCAGIVTAQLNRQADWVDLKTGERVIPRMSMIKSSGTIEQASSRVLLLSETRVTPEGSEIVGNLDKNDNGPKGMCHFMLTNSPYRMIEL